LQARRQIRRGAHRQLGLVPGASRFTDDDRAGGDADADRQGFDSRCPLDAMNDLQGRPHRWLGVFFVAPWPAKICQDGVPHVARDETIVAPNRIAAEGSIRVQQAAQFFRIKLFTQRRRTHSSS
jgi:hypothetical protein